MSQWPLVCGIAGFVSLERPAGEPLLGAMLDVLRHRGPDSEGRWSEGPAALGACRLAVIDVPGGRQPLGDESGRFWIAYNGEVYNFRELRAELEREGARFRTSSDTEVVVQWFARRGEAGLARLNGMFAFAIWDRADRRLWLARDRCGKKPLYYALLDDGIVFASELKAVAAHPRVSRDIAPLALARYFAFDFVPSPATPLAAVRKLEPGTSLRWQRDSAVEHRYWSLPEIDGQERGIEERVRETLRAGVRRRLVSDVPLGVFLSGGIDSSAVTAFAREAGPVRSFSIGFSDPTYDESDYAQEVARALGTEHVCEKVRLKDAAEIAPEIVGRMDDLLADSSIVPTYLLSRLARKHVTVALGGDGGDELFAGYPTFFAHRVADKLRLAPRALWRMAGWGARLLPVSHAYQSPDFIATRFSRGMAVEGRWRHQAWIGSFAPWEVRRLLPDAPSDAEIYADLDRFAAVGDSVERALAESFRFYLGEGVLTKVDRAAMMVSLEVRAPFLDDDMIDLAWRIPWSLKLRGRAGKEVLKRALAGLLPERILRRRKQGFAMPVARWLTRELKPVAEEFLFRGSVDAGFVRRLWKEHQRRERNRARELWSVLVYEIWRDAVRRWPIAPS